MKYCLRLLLIFALMLSLKGVLFAQPPDVADSISGLVLDAGTQIEIPDARIAVFHNGHTLLKETETTEDGAFHAAALLTRHQRQPEDWYVLLVRADGYEMTALAIKPGAIEATKIELAPDRPREFRITDSQGKPVAGASVELLSIYAPLVGEEEARSLVPLPLSGLAGKTAPVPGDEQGVVILNGLSPDGGKLEIRAPGFASLQRELSDVREGTIQLSRETVIAGRILYEHTGLPFYHPTPVAKVQAWRHYRLWRQSPIKPDGSFEIGDIPSLEMMGEESISINIELGISDVTKAVTGNDITIRYAPNGYNAFVALDATENAPQKWYLGYVQTGAKGVLYTEGERVEMEYFLHPLALIKGRVLPLPNGEPATVSYHDPSSWYADWSVSTDAAGNFEIFAPVGDVTLKFHHDGKSGELPVKDLKGHETREVELDFDQK